MVFRLQHHSQPWTMLFAIECTCLLRLIGSIQCIFPWLPLLNTINTTRRRMHAGYIAHFQTRICLASRSKYKGIYGICASASSNTIAGSYPPSSIQKHAYAQVKVHEPIVFAGSYAVDTQVQHDGSVVPSAGSVITLVASFRW